jgi:uncharacterized membrane protein
MYSRYRPYNAKKRRLLAERQLDRCHDSSLATVVERNIETMDEHRRDADESRRVQDRIADWITHLSGSMAFVYFHVVWFAAWLLLNSGVGGLTAFDPFPYGLLTTIVSLEAIFLSTFVLVSQNRQAAIAEQRTELDLQINLLSEYELTRVLSIVNALAKKFDLDVCDDGELKELEKDVKPKALLHELDVKANKQDGKSAEPPRGRAKPS